MFDTIEDINRKNTTEPILGVIYGQAGLGKTTLAYNLATNSALLDLDASLSGRCHKEALAAGKLKKLTFNGTTANEVQETLVSFFQKVNDTDVDTLILDCIDNQEQFYCDYFKAEKNWPDMGHLDFGKCWIPVAEALNKFIDDIWVFCKYYKINLIVVSHEALFKEKNLLGEDTQRSGLAISKRSESLLTSKADFCFYLHNKSQIEEVDAGFGGKENKIANFTRTVETRRTPIWVAKERGGIEPFEFKLDADLSYIREALCFCEREKTIPTVAKTATVEPVQTPIEKPKPSIPIKELNTPGEPVKNTVDEENLPKVKTIESATLLQLREKINSSTINENQLKMFLGEFASEIIYPFGTDLEAIAANDDAYLTRLLVNFDQIVLERIIPNVEAINQSLATKGII